MECATENWAICVIRTGDQYEHAFDVTLSVIVHVPSPNRQRNRITKYQILERLCKIVHEWSPEEAEGHVEGDIDYVESNVLLTKDQSEARAGLLSAGYYFNADEETT